MNFSSIHLVVMTTMRTFCSHIILQKSGNVLGSGPGIIMNSENKFIIFCKKPVFLFPSLHCTYYLVFSAEIQNICLVFPLWNRSLLCIQQLFFWDKNSMEVNNCVGLCQKVTSQLLMLHFSTQESVAFVLPFHERLLKFFYVSQSRNSAYSPCVEM